MNNPFSISSQNGVLSAQFVMAHSVENNGYTHYCYKYTSPGQVVESPTLRVNPGDRSQKKVVVLLCELFVVRICETSLARGPSYGLSFSSTLGFWFQRPRL